VAEPLREPRLSGVLLDGAWETTIVADAIRGKLERLGLTGYAAVVGRNLSALVAVRR
jgi:hypothetical protein